MTGNVGGVDPALRVQVGPGLLSLVFLGPETPWGWIRVVPLLAGLIG
jgi:hypothetical protein